jgi:hypothetical protein
MNLKVVSPAMNYGTMPGYANPTLWLEEFFGTDGHPGFDNVYLSDIDAISIHLYNDFGDNVRRYIDRFRKFGKPIWMTEWCAWDDRAGVHLTSHEFQITFMSQSVIYMEFDPAVDRYAWFIPKGGAFNSEDVFPYNKLLTAPALPTLPELTPLGKVYAHMSSLDTSFYFLSGEIIPAKDFSNSNISELAPSSDSPYAANSRSWQDGVRFRPTTNTGSEVTVLDIVFLSPGNNTTNMWVEYQIAVPETRQYSITFCYTASQNMGFEVTVNERNAQNITLNQAPGWNTQTNSLSLSAGRNIVRIRKTTPTGNCAINWLKVE